MPWICPFICLSPASCPQAFSSAPSAPAGWLPTAAWRRPRQLPRGCGGDTQLRSWQRLQVSLRPWGWERGLTRPRIASGLLRQQLTGARGRGLEGEGSTVWELAPTSTHAQMFTQPHHPPLNSGMPDELFPSPSDIREIDPPAPPSCSQRRSPCQTTSLLRVPSRRSRSCPSSPCSGSARSGSVWHCSPWSTSQALAHSSPSRPLPSGR